MFLLFFCLKISRQRSKTARSQAEVGYAPAVRPRLSHANKIDDVVTFSSSVFSPENIGEVVEDRRGYKIETKI